jgi:hypothetical protein
MNKIIGDKYVSTGSHLDLAKLHDPTDQPPAAPPRAPARPDLDPDGPGDAGLTEWWRTPSKRRFWRNNAA